MRFKLLPSGKWQSRAIALSHDIAAIPLAWLVAYWFRFSPGVIPPAILAQALKMLPFLVTVQVTAYFSFGLYRGIWGFASLPDLVRIIKAVAAGTAVSALGIAFFTQFQQIPRSVFLLYGLLLILFLGGSRLFYRWFRYNMNSFSDAKRVLIIGGGQAGEGLIRDLLRDADRKFNPIAILDDRRQKQGLEIHGVRVVGKLKDMLAIVKQFNIDMIFIAVPSASSKAMQRIVSFCEQTQLPFRTLPGLKDLASGNVSINALREVSIEDLLGREPVSLDWEAINQSLNGKTILVSGGGGSIGSELCRQIAKLNPAGLIVIEHSEYNLYALELEMKRSFPQLNFYAHLLDVTDKVAVEKVFSQYRPEVIFHAAAYKHVPLLESQLRVAVRNNILGTWVIAQQAVAYAAQQFVLISTDKAVNPTNVMGASKRVAEILCQNLDSQSSTDFITVRFGNVLDSAGSVVPLFRQQIAAGGPVTVTHPEVSRFFMTIPEASQLILQATTIGRGGEIFVLDMGEPIKITYLAEQLIRLSGLSVGTDIEIQYTGLRPGEKLHEELFHESEHLISTGHEKIMQAQYRPFDWQELVHSIREMVLACETSSEIGLRELLSKLVPEYQGQQLSRDEIPILSHFSS